MVSEFGGFANYCADAGRLPFEISQTVVRFLALQIKVGFFRARLPAAGAASCMVS
jgi:hypothetical protein